MITVYTLPSIAALALKLSIFWFGRYSLRVASPYLWGFFIGLFGMNLSELATFYYVTQPEEGFVWLSAYYISAVIAFFSLFTLSISNAISLPKVAVVCLGVLFLIVVFPLFVPGMALSGVKSIGYSITRISGPYYFMVQIGILVPLMLSLVISFYFSCFSKSYLVRKRSQILLVSCFPIFITVIVIMLLMHLGFKINAAVILSFMITVTLLILVFTEHKEHQYKFMSLIPKTKENIFVKRLSYLVTDPAVGLDKGRDLIEQEMIRQALIICKGNKIDAAEMLGVSRQTLQRRLDKAHKDTVGNK